MRRDHRLEPGDVEHALDLVADAADREAAVELLPGPDDQGDTGRVDEFAAAQVDQQVRVRRRQGQLQLTLELGRRVHVQLALDLDYEHVPLLLAANFERRGSQCNCDATGGCAAPRNLYSPSSWSKRSAARVGSTSDSPRCSRPAPVRSRTARSTASRRANESRFGSSSRTSSSTVVAAGWRASTCCSTADSCALSSSTVVRMSSLSSTGCL